MSRLKFATEHVLWTEDCGIVFISAMNQSLTCSVVTEEGSFDAVLRNNIRLCALKAALNLEDEVWWYLARILLLVQDFLTQINATVYKEILRKPVVPNLRTAINQPPVFMQDNAPCYTAKSFKTFLSEEDVTVMEWPAQSLGTNPIDNV